MKYYEIKQIIISSYHSEVNKLIENNYKLVVDALFKFINSDKNWKLYFHLMFMINYIFVQNFIDKISFKLKYDYNIILFIKLLILTW